MRLTQFRTLLAVAEAGSIRAAAHKLGRTQPALTKSLQQLERELNAPVFRRSTRGVVLTEVGEVAARRARAIMLEVERLEDEVAQMAGQRTGSVRIVASPIATTRILPSALGLFRRQWPAAEVVIIAAVYPQAFTLLREGHVDFVIGPVPRNLSLGALSIEPLFETDYVILCASANPRRSVQSLHDLSDANWLIFGPSDGPSSLFAETFASHGMAQPLAVTRSDSLAAALAIVETSDAFCVLTSLVLAYVADRYAISKVDVRERLPRSEHSIVTAAGSTLTPAAEALAAAVRRQSRAMAREQAKR